MVGIVDPPYRFDPWQNLVGVHWDRGTSYTWHHQFFIFRRWSGPPYNGIFSWSGDWYPVSDEFAYAAYVAGDFDVETMPMQGVELHNGQDISNYSLFSEFRTKRSDLIKDGLSLSLGEDDTDRTTWPGSFLFYYWDRNSTLSSSNYSLIQPYRGDPKQHFVYYDICGGYLIDDMSEQDWADLASGTGAFNGVPVFNPP